MHLLITLRPVLTWYASMRWTGQRWAFSLQPVVAIVLRKRELVASSQTEAV